MSRSTLPSCFVHLAGVALLLAAVLSGPLRAAEAALVFQSDFSLEDGAVKTGEPLRFMNSSLEVSLALNTDSFAKKFGISSGPEWSLEIRRIGK